EADWAYFQNELDRCDFVLLGRKSHEATPNPRGRRRLILSSSADGLERRADGWWWNPARAPWSEVASRLMPGGGRVGAPGGRDVFDYLVRDALAEFHLSRSCRIWLPQGRGLFSAVESGESAEQILERNGF